MVQVTKYKFALIVANILLIFWISSVLVLIALGFRYLDPIIVGPLAFTQYMEIPYTTILVWWALFAAVIIPLDLAEFGVFDDMTEESITPQEERNYKKLVSYLKPTIDFIKRYALIIGLVFIAFGLFLAIAPSYPYSVFPPDITLDEVYFWIEENSPVTTFIVYWGYLRTQLLIVGIFFIITGIFFIKKLEKT